MIKSSKPFLIITFLMAFSLAFYFANKMYPVFGNKVAFVTQYAIDNNRKLPITDENKNVLTQIIAYEPNKLELVYTLPQVEAYKLDADSITKLLQNLYDKPTNHLLENLNKTDVNLEINYLFKDKNQTKITSFKKDFLMITSN